jgi:hypothetical protein
MSEPEPIPWPLPTPDDVAALLRARTKDADGHELGVFTDTTRPTADQVDELIALAYGDVSSQTGAYLDDRTAYPEYERLYTAGMTALGDAIDGNTAGSGIPRFASVPIMSATTAAYYSGMGSVWPEPENPANWPDPLFPPVSPVGDEPSHRARPLPSVPPLVIGLRGSVIRRRHGN